MAVRFGLLLVCRAVVNRGVAMRCEVGRVNSDGTGVRLPSKANGLPRIGWLRATVVVTDFAAVPEYPSPHVLTSARL